jgi:hypothetical protein
MASIYESVVSILKQPVTPKGTTVRDTLVESDGLARPTKDTRYIDEAARYHAGQHVTGKYRSGTGHYTIDHVVKGTEDSSDPEYVVTQHDNHVSASGKKEPKQLKHRQSDLHATNEDRLSVEFNALIESTAEVLSEAASRKDYVAVAKILHDAGSAGDDQFESPAHAAGYRRAIKHLGAELADHFKRTNSAFSHDRFRKAAGLDDVER